MTIETELLREYAQQVRSIADGELIGVVADVMTDQLNGQMAELEVQMRRLLADVALATNG